MKIPVETFIAFWNERTAREKTMFALLLVCFILFLDYLLFIRPVQAIFADTLPRLGSLKQELRGLRQDRKNKEGIEREWTESKATLKEAESHFIRSDEISVVLGKVSEIAQSSGVKLISLVPVPMEKGEARAGLYTSVPISINGIAGTHAIGRFLAKLESSRIYSRVVSVRISENPSDVRRHLFELQLTAMQKAGAS